MTSTSTTPSTHDEPPHYFFTNQGTMFCPYCGTRNSDQARTCISCGTALAQPLPPPDFPWAEDAPTQAAPVPDRSQPLDPYAPAGQDDANAARPVFYDQENPPPTLPPQVPAEPAWQDTQIYQEVAPAPQALPGQAPIMYRPRRAAWVGPLVLVVALGLIAGGVGFVVAATNGDDKSTGSTTHSTTVTTTTVASTSTGGPSTTGPSTTGAESTTTESTTTEATTTTEAPSTTEAPTTTVPPTDPPTTTAAPPTTVDPAVEAKAQLDDWVDGDHDTVEGLVGKWVPQVGAKRVGTKDDGITYTLPDIVDNHQSLRDDLGAVLLRSKDYVFKDDRLWVSIAPVGFGSSADALDWCSAHSLDGNHCFAKFITHDESIDNTTAYP